MRLRNDAVAEDAAEAMISRHAREGTSLRLDFFQRQAQALRQCALLAALRLANGGKVLLCGAPDFAWGIRQAADALAHGSQERPLLPVLAMTERPQELPQLVEALALPHDMLLCLSAVGDDMPVLGALQTAQRLRLGTAAICPAGHAAPFCDVFAPLPDAVPADTACELLLECAHLLCRLVDYYLFDNVMALLPHMGGGQQQN